MPKPCAGQKNWANAVSPDIPFPSNFGMPLMQSHSTRSDLLRRYGPWILIAIAAVAYYPRFIKSADGLELYPHAAYCLLSGQMIKDCELLFSYPPAFAFFMIPFEPMPMWLREAVWYLITIGATIGAFKLSTRLADVTVAPPLNATEMAWTRLLCVLASVKFVLAVLENQAYDTLELLLILLGLAALVARREMWGGAALAVATAIKATPLVFLPYLLLRRRFAAAGIFVVVLAIVSYLPDLFFPPNESAHGHFVAWLHDVAAASVTDDGITSKHNFWHGANPLNHSLRGAVARIIDDKTHVVLHQTVLYALDGLLVAIIGILLVLLPRRRESIAIDGSLLLIAMLMLSPMTSRSHYIALMLPYAVLIALCFRDEVTKNLGRIVFWTSFVLVTAASNDIVGSAVTNWSYGHSLMVFGALILLIYFAVITWRRHRAERVPLAHAVSPSR
jgi:hypothetical protein